VPEARRVAVRGPHGLGKTTLAAWLILWAVAYFETQSLDYKIITTASAWRQLTKYLWPEVRKWYRRIDWARLGLHPEMNLENIRTDHGEVFAVASDSADLIEGAHAARLLYVFDEAKAIPNETWDAVEGAFSTGECMALAISTPGGRAGRFYDICRRARGYEDWRAEKVTLEEAIAAGRVKADWAAARLRQWGADSPVYQARVLGDFPEMSDRALISLAWLEAARERELEPVGVRALGVDIARFGSDDSALFERQGPVIVGADVWHGNDTMASTGRVAARGRIPANVDEIGVGAGVVDRLKELDHPTAGVNVGAAASEPDKFNNLRTELFWNLRLRFQTGEIDLTRLDGEIYDRLSGELTAMEFNFNSRGQIVLEPKDNMREKLGFSPDLSDALALSFADEGAPENVGGMSLDAKTPSRYTDVGDGGGGRWGRADGSKAYHKERR